MSLGFCPNIFLSPDGSPHSVHSAALIWTIFERTDPRNDPDARVFPDTAKPVPDERLEDG